MIGFIYAFWHTGIQLPNHNDDSGGYLNTGNWRAHRLTFMNQNNSGVVFQTNLFSDTIIDYTFNAVVSYINTNDPSRHFTGWYLDEAFTIPSPTRMPNQDAIFFPRFVATTPTPAHMFNINAAGLLASNGNGFSATWDGRLDIVIPSVINGIPLTGFQIRAFSGRNLRSVVLPNVPLAFAGEVFMNNNLRNINVPNNASFSGNRTFNNNALQNVNLPNSLTNIITEMFFNNQLSRLVLPTTVTNIGIRAFSNNNLMEVVLPNGLTEIGTDAFSNNNLTSLTIPGTVTAFAIRAFERNDLRSIVILPGLTTIPAGVFDHNPNLTTVIIPASVINIGNRAFWYTALQTVYFGGTETQWNAIIKTSSWTSTTPNIIFTP
jgi:hypothetical protein